VTPDLQLNVLRLIEGDGVRELVGALLSKSLQDCVSHLSILRWASTANSVGPTSRIEVKHGLMPLLLLSDGFRLVVLDPNEFAHNFAVPATKNGESPRYLIADYQLGDQFGRLSHATFMLDSEHVMVLFETGVHASIFCLTKPQREDIPNIKFNTGRGISPSLDGRSIALLLRNKGQDQVTVLGLETGQVQVQSTFSTHTNDAQGLVWSPDGDPVVAVYESAAYGTKLLFFSAMGHPLKQLEVSQVSDVSGASGAGVTNVKWAAVNNETMLAVADGEKNILLRRQHNKTMSVQQLALLRHATVIDGSRSIVWQESGVGEHLFLLQKGAFGAVVEPHAEGDVKILETNCDCSFIATVVADNPKAIWLWQPDHPEPHTVILFQQNVQQVLWHPAHPGVLVAMTSQKSPMVYVWYSETKAPAASTIPVDTSNSTKFQGSWLRRSIRGRYPFMLTTTKSFELGILEERGGSVIFQSLLQDMSALGCVEEGDDLTQDISTPSEPSKRIRGDGDLHAMSGPGGPKIDAADGSRW
jgi:hypothetical protein